MMRSLYFTVQLFLRYPPPSLPTPTTSPKRTLYFRSLRRSISAVTATATATMDQNLIKKSSSPAEHIAGPWYSVPELRLRDHHFTVPLDYSLSQSPKISVFAREAVSGKSLTSTFIPELFCTNYESWLPLNHYTHHFNAKTFSVKGNSLQCKVMWTLLTNLISTLLDIEFVISNYLDSLSSRLLC